MTATWARWAWALVVVYMALIFVLSSISNTPALPGGSDKQLHGLLYGGLAGLIMRALAGGWNRRMTMGMAVTAIVIAGLYGISDEYHQSFVPNRQSDPSDVVADTVGAAVAAFACVGWARATGGPTRSSRPV